MKKYPFLLSLLFLSVINCYGQTITNVQARTEGNKVIITYDLVSNTQGEKFKIELRSSINNYTSILKEVTGDVGPDQEPGTGKSVTWDAYKEQGKFSGSVSFDITAILTFSPLSITQPTAGTGVKLGKNLRVEWTGGDKTRALKMAILQGNTTITEVPDIGSSGQYLWYVPKTLSKGDNYQVKLFDPSKPNDAVLSAKFKLKKTSILIYIIPGVLVAGGAAYFATRDKGTDPGGGTSINPVTPTPEDLASPPPPPGGGN